MAYRKLRAPVNSGIMGVCYLIHLERPIAHAQHYQGWYQDRRRLEHHGTKNGANFLWVAAQRGISWQVVLEVPGDKNLERLFKNRGGARRRCPVCQEEARRATEQAERIARWLSSLHSHHPDGMRLPDTNRDYMEVGGVS